MNNQKYVSSKNYSCTVKSPKESDLNDIQENDFKIAIINKIKVLNKDMINVEKKTKTDE